jgi:hypothetical protein
MGAAARRCSADELPDHVFVVYHDSWNEWPASTPQQTSLAKLPAYFDVVLLAFARPDAVYRGGLHISRTGLEYQMTSRGVGSLGVCAARGRSHCC